MLAIGALAGPPELYETDVAADCRAGDTSACLAHAVLLARGTWGEGREADALRAARRGCVDRLLDACRVGLLIARQHPELVVGGEASLWPEACEVGDAWACLETAYAAESGGDSATADDARAAACRLRYTWACGRRQTRRTPRRLPAITRDLLEQAHLELLVAEGLRTTRGAGAITLVARDVDLEIRISLHPIGHLVAARQACGPPPECTMPDPNLLPTIAVRQGAEALGEAPQFAELPALPTRVELGATWAGTARVGLGEGSDEPWTEALILAMHRRDVGYAVLTFLYDDQDAVEPWLQAGFHTLRFRDPAPLD